MEEKEMAITTCSHCGWLYEEKSEEEANKPDRLCVPCFRGAQIPKKLNNTDRPHGTGGMGLSPEYLDSIKEIQ